MVLPSILLVTMVLVLLAGILVTSGSSSLRATTREQSSNQALYAAEAGLAITVEEFDRTTKLEGDERQGELSESRASYRVVIFRNEDIQAKTVHHELLSPDGVLLPAGTMYLLSTGRSENGTTRQAGALFRIGLEAIEVGVLSERLLSRNSEFKAYDSSASVDPGSLSKSDSGLLASNRVDASDTSAEFDLADTKVDGGVYVAPHSTPSKGIVKSGTTTVSREGVLGGPITLEEIVVPDISGSGTSTGGSSGTGDDDTKEPAQGNAGTLTLGDLLVSWGGNPVEVSFHELDGGQVGSSIGTISLSKLQGTINHSTTYSSKELLARDGDETVSWADGQFHFSDDDGNLGSGPPSGGLLELLKLGPSVTDVQNPETLAGGKEYGTVTITDSTPTVLEDGVIVIKNLEITSGGTLQLPEGRKATIYVTESLKVEGENALLNSTKLPPNLKIFYTGQAPVSLAGGAQAYFTLIAPGSDVLLRGEQLDARTSFYGALVGKTVTVENANFYFDLATKGIGSGAQGSSLRLLNRHRL